VGRVERVERVPLGPGKVFVTGFRIGVRIVHRGQKSASIWSIERGWLRAIGKGQSLASFKVELKRGVKLRYVQESTLILAGRGHTEDT
jgi:hypothetical protein